MRKIGLLAIVIAVLVSTASAVPRYSEALQQVGVYSETINPVSRMLKMETALKKHSETLSRPNVDLISSDEVSGYPYVDRYLNEQLGDKDITHYYILCEDYKFQDLSGENITIPAGFIWDGASIPRNAWAYYPVAGLDAGNSRYNSALAEGLIHDYMYRDSQRFSKEDADDLLYVNLVRCGNANPKKIYKAVQVAGGDSYQGHKNRQDQGLYDVFTPEFYKENMTIYQSCRASHKPKVFDRDSQCKKNDQLEEMVCHANPDVLNDSKTKDSDDTDRVDLTGEFDDHVGVRGWCICGEDHGKRYVVGDMFCMYSKLECDLAYTVCGRCGHAVHSKDCAGEGLQIVDVKLYKELKRRNGGKLAWLDAVDPLKARQSKLEAIPDGQIVVAGKCACREPDPIKVGFTNRETGEFFVCCLCGRVREPDENGDIPNGPTNLSEMGLDELANKASERILEWLGASQ